MGSNYFGEANLGLGSERSAGGGSSRKGKKNGSSDKPKQPQRGLGVAQLEKIRLHSQLAYIQPPYPIPNPIQEDVRLQTPYSSSSSSFSYTPVQSSSSYAFHAPQNIMMGLGDHLEIRANRYADSSPTTNAGWSAGNTVFDAQHYQQPASITRHFLNLETEESAMEKKKKKSRRSDSTGSGGSQNSGSSGSQELDLELRLSI